MGIRRRPELLSGNVSGPMICGFLSPSVILPEGFSNEGIQMVLAHELAHVKRRDVMWAWLPMLAQLFFFFNPLVWILRKEWLFTQEAACDAMAIEVTSATHAEYGRMLLSHVVPGSEGGRLVTIGVSEPYNTLKRRLKAMLKSRNVSKRKSILIGTIALAVGVLANAFAVTSSPQLPSWAPQNPSPEFVRAARVLKPLPPETNHTVGSLDVPIWECFGTLTDQQIKDFMKIRQEKQRIADLSSESISSMKRDYGATEEGGYITYNVRSRDVPINELSDALRKALDKVFEEAADAAKRERRPGCVDILAGLYECGAKRDLSNVSLVFYAGGGHDVHLQFLGKVSKTISGQTTWSGFCILTGSYAYIDR